MALNPHPISSQASRLKRAQALGEARRANREARHALRLYKEAGQYVADFEAELRMLQRRLDTAKETQRMAHDHLLARIGKRRIRIDGRTYSARDGALTIERIPVSLSHSGARRRRGHDR